MGAALGAGPMWGAKRGVCPRATWGGTLENGGAPPIAVGRQLGDDRLEGLFENLRFQRLLAQEPMKFANLVLQSPILRSRHDLFPAAGRSQTALRHQPTPGEQLVWGNAMPTSHQAYRHTRLEGLFDHANLLRGRPAPTTLNRRDDLNAIGQIGHRHGCMPHTCQVGDRVRSVRGLSQPGAIGISTTPTSASRDFAFASASTALISLLSLSMIPTGVFFGAPTPNHPLAS